RANANNWSLGIVAFHDGRLTWSLELLLAKEVSWTQPDHLPSLRAALHLKAHLDAAALLCRQNVGRIGVEVDVGDGEAPVFVGGHLQELISELEVVVKPKERHHLVVEQGEILHIAGIEDVQYTIEVVGLHAALQVG